MDCACRRSNDSAQHAQCRSDMRHGHSAQKAPSALVNILEDFILSTTVCTHDDHLTKTVSCLPFSTIYVASSAPVPVPTFFAEWIVLAGMKRTSPALSVTGAFPSS